MMLLSPSPDTPPAQKTPPATFPNQIIHLPQAEVQLPLFLSPDEQHSVTELGLDPEGVKCCCKPRGTWVCVCTGQDLTVTGSPLTSLQRGKV